MPAHAGVCRHSDYLSRKRLYGQTYSLHNSAWEAIVMSVEVTKGSRRVMRKTVLVLLLISQASWIVDAQQKPDDLSQRVAELTNLVQKLQARVDELERKPGVTTQPTVSTPTVAPDQASASQVLPAPSTPPTGSSLLGGTTVNILVDGRSEERRVGKERR